MAEVFYSKYTAQQIESLLDTVADNNGINTDNDTELYGFRICGPESSPYSRVEYIGANRNYEPAGMDFANDKFNYGSWENAFFIKNLKPVMLYSDGSIAYELDKNDYSLKVDGTASDIDNVNFDGNAMIGFPTIWFKSYQTGIYKYVFISNKQLDEDYHAYSHTDNNGQIIDYCFVRMFEGSLINSKLRSISGQSLMVSNTAANEITYATANNTTSDVIWYTGLVNDMQMINRLLILISKSTNTQATFGYGHYTGGSSASSLLKTGTMNDKGLFWGTNTTGKGVKVFGIENWWGNAWERIGGYILNSYKIYAKFTYGREDGSTTDGYNLDGTGYNLITNYTLPSVSGVYIKENYCDKFGFWPYLTGGTQETYETDGLWTTSGITYGLFGGYCSNGFLVGALYVSLAAAASVSYWTFSASLSCKPLKQ